SLEEYRGTLADHKLVVIDFFATWCGPCKTIAPLVVEASNQPEFQHIHFAKIDVEELEAVSEEVGIRAMPTLVLFKDGKKVEEIVGPAPNALIEFFKKAE
ncbi:putative thioredoxin G6G8.7, partial [Stachybotrys elegans]